jgi:ABC-type glycerol-3-phosphate transport system permease component
MISTALFAFMLAFSDFLVVMVLIDAQNHTMVSAITGYFPCNTTTDQLWPAACEVSASMSLFLLFVLFLQRKIVSGAFATAMEK